MEYGLIGEHLGHSWSVEIHGLIAPYSYELCELAPDELGPFLKARQFKGLNVTIPYKEAVIPYLDELSPEARSIGAVNTILHSDGKLIGFNTDYYGFSALAAHADIKFAGKSVLILGAGGAAKAVRAVATNEGAARIVNAVRHYSKDVLADKHGPCRTIGNSLNRTAEAERPSNIDNDTDWQIQSVLGNQYIECLYKSLQYEDYEIIVNATPVGMYPNERQCLLDLRSFPKLCGVLDCVYNPEQTLLVKDAKKSGVPADGGLFMLVAQAVRASAIFTGNAEEKSAGEVVELSQVEKIYEYMRKMHNFATAFD